MNKIESYVDSVIPKNIPKYKQKILRDEIEAHIYDRIDFYTEIGYDNDASINKALADMGEDEETKSSAPKSKPTSSTASIFTPKSATIATQA